MVTSTTSDSNSSEKKRTATVNGRVTSSLSAASSSIVTSRDGTLSNDNSPDVITSETSGTTGKQTARSLRRNPRYLPGEFTFQIYIYTPSPKLTNSI